MYLTRNTCLVSGKGFSLKSILNTNSIKIVRAAFCKHLKTHLRGFDQNRGWFIKTLAPIFWPKINFSFEFGQKDSEV